MVSFLRIPGWGVSQHGRTQESMQRPWDVQGVREYARSEGRSSRPPGTEPSTAHPPPPGRAVQPQPGLPSGGGWGQSLQGSRSTPGPRPVQRRSPWSPFPLALVQEGGGEAWGRTTGAKALFCFTAEMTLAGENEKMPCVLLQFEGRVTEEAAMVGLDGTTATKQTGQDTRRQARQHDREPSRPCRGHRGQQGTREVLLAWPLSG